MMQTSLDVRWRPIPEVEDPNLLCAQGRLFQHLLRDFALTKTSRATISR